MIITKQMANSGPVLNKDKWATPDKIFKPLMEEFGFTLDPCCEEQNAKAVFYFTIAEDGLKQDWSGHTVYVNPPYSRGNIDKWVEKCFKESQKPKTIVVALLPVSTSADWWHRWVWKKATLRFIKGRVQFVGAEHTAPFSSVIAIWPNYL